MRKLVLITSSFPYGKGEKTFIIPELEVLVNFFDITIITMPNSRDLHDRQHITRLDKRIRLLRCGYVLRKRSFPEKLSAFCTAIANKIVLKEISAALKRTRNIKCIYDIIYFFAQAERFKKWFIKNNIVETDEDAVCYTYWNREACLALALCRHTFRNMRLVSRFHGDDLYLEQTPNGWQPFKKYIDAHIDRCFFVSNAGYNYYLEHFADMEAADTDKYNISRLGVLKRKNKNPDKREDAFHIVSCSFIISLKRINLIIDALGCIADEHILWTHFGSGELEGSIKGYADKLLGGKANIKYEFMGYCPNGEIMEYYEKVHVDCFITVSSTEGMPVSIQEALCMGIPIIGTDVGGVLEGISNNNGILLDANPTPQEIADSILKLYHMPESEISKLRANSYSLYLREYNAEVNAVRFKEQLEKL